MAGQVKKASSQAFGMEMSRNAGRRAESQFHATRGQLITLRKDSQKRSDCVQ